MQKIDIIKFPGLGLCSQAIEILKDIDGVEDLAQELGELSQGVPQNMEPLWDVPNHKGFYLYHLLSCIRHECSRLSFVSTRRTLSKVRDFVFGAETYRYEFLSQALRRCQGSRKNATILAVESRLHSLAEVI